MRRTLHAMLALAIAVALGVGLPAASAVAAPAPPTPASISLNFDSPGNAAWWLGNLATRIYWFNQDASLISTPTLYSYPSSGTITLDYLGLSFNGSEYASITASPKSTVLSAEGIYTFDAWGSDDADTSFEASRTFGVDKTLPSSRSNLVPVYTGSALITITASDALSGAEFVLYTLDGKSQYAVPSIGDSGGYMFAAKGPAEIGNAFDAGITVTTPGVHKLSWFTVDNAGNHEAWHYTTFRINKAGYVPVLGKPTTAVDGHRVGFKGSVTAASHNRPVTLTVQRKSGGSWVHFATYSKTVAKYHDSYWMKKTIAKHGTYRVMATQGAGKSRWSKEFRVR